MADEDSSDASSSSFNLVTRPRAWTTHGEQSPAGGTRDPWSFLDAAQHHSRSSKDTPLVSQHSTGDLDLAPERSSSGAAITGYPDTFRVEHTAPPSHIRCPMHRPALSPSRLHIVRTILSPFLHEGVTRGRSGSRRTAGSARSGAPRRRPRRAATISAADRKQVQEEIRRWGHGDGPGFEFHRRAQLADEEYECQVHTHAVWGAVFVQCTGPQHGAHAWSAYFQGGHWWLRSVRSGHENMCPMCVGGGG